MKYKILSLLIITMILGCVKEKHSNKPLLQFVPEKASVIVKINDLSEFKNALSANNFLSNLYSTSTFKKALSKIEFINVINTKSESLLAFIENEKGVFESVYIVADSTNLYHTENIKFELINTFDIDGISINEYQINNTLFYQYIIESHVVISSAKKTIIHLIETFNTKTTSAQLKKLFEISDNYRSASLFLNLKNSNSLIQSVLTDSSTSNVSNFADWVSLDLNPKPSFLQLSGISTTKDSIYNFIDLFANTKPLPHNTLSLAPQKIDALISYTFNDFSLFKKNQSSYLNEELPINMFFETAEEISIAHYNKQKAVFISTHGSELLVEHLEQNKKAVIDYQGSQILHLQNQRFIENEFTPLIQNFKSTYCTFFYDALVFSETQEFIQYIITNYKNGTTYNKNDTFQSLSEVLAEESNILFLSNADTINAVLGLNFSSQFSNELKSSLITPHNIVVQITAEKKFYHTNIIVKTVESVVGEKGVSELFNTIIDTTIANDPQFVTNFKDKKKNIVVQDFNNILYYISSEGQVLWKKQLKGQIQGKIHEVDLTKNGQLQLAFTTDKELIAIDHKGNQIDFFTKTFDEGGLNSLAVFDYSKNKNYRFVVTQGKKTFMYNNKGKIVDGFKYTEAEDTILDAPKHIRIASKDYLIFKLKNGSLKILDRIGNDRVKINETIDFSDNEVYLNKNNFALTAKNGLLYQIDQSGKIKKNNLNLSSDHGFFATAKTLVIMNDHILTIREKKATLDLGVYTAPRIFYINDKIYVSVTDLQSQKVYLFDSQAKLISNFPVFGNSNIDLADINNDNILDLVVIGDNNTVLTYKVKTP